MREDMYNSKNRVCWNFLWMTFLFQGFGLPKGLRFTVRTSKNKLITILHIKQFYMNVFQEMDQ